MQKLEIVKKTIEEFFKKSTFNVIIESLSEKDITFFINIKTEDPQILIGEGGQSLNEIQYLLKKILKKKIKDFFYFDIDINNYKKKKKEYLKEMIYFEADEVVLSKKEKELAPMPAYERRMVHLILAERKDVITESVGQGMERRIKIKPL
jgi:spoIIIJ-associated protein